MDPKALSEPLPPTRREFLIVGGTVATAAVAVADEYDAYVRPPTFVARIRRDFDLIDLELAFIGFREKDGYLVPYPGRRRAFSASEPRRSQLQRDPPRYRIRSRSDRDGTGSEEAGPERQFPNASGPKLHFGHESVGF